MVRPRAEATLSPMSQDFGCLAMSDTGFKGPKTDSQPDLVQSQHVLQKFPDSTREAGPKAGSPQRIAQPRAFVRTD